MKNIRELQNYTLSKNSIYCLKQVFRSLQKETEAFERNR